MKKLRNILLSVLAAITMISIIAYIAQCTNGEIIPATYVLSVSAKMEKMKRNGEYVRNFGPGTYTCSERGGDLQPGTYMFYITARSAQAVVDMQVTREGKKNDIAFEAYNYGPVGFTVEDGDTLRVRYGSGYLVKAGF